MGGRTAAYLHVKHVSAAAGFERETYLIPAGSYEYTFTCGTQVGAGDHWGLHGPKCEEIMQSLEVGIEQGFISRVQALEAARAATQWEHDATLTLLEEKFDLPGVGVVPVWRVELTPKAGAKYAFWVVVDARSGKVHYVLDPITGAQKRPR